MHGFLITCALVAWGAAPPRPAAEAAPQAGAEPSSAPWAGWKWEGPKDEHWLAAAIEDELRRGTGAKARKELTERLGTAALAWLATGRMEPFDTGADLIHALRACQYLAMLETDKSASGPKLAQWLLEHREVRHLLFRALAETNSPKEALQRFAELQADECEKVLGYPNLAVAFATARPLRHYEKQPEPASLREAFCYYADPKKQFRYNLKKMPYELSRYLADTRLSLAERDWAYKQYFRMPDLSGTYFHVKYDTAYYRENKAKKISELPYTLQGLFKVGGVCIDQAYYASEVCKALGIPATIVSGRGASGISHAWFTYFQMNPAGTSASWSGGAGRYASHLYFTGNVDDPATGQGILDTELVLVGSAALLPVRRREEAEAAAQMARVVAQVSEKGDVELDVAALKDLASRFETSFASQAGAPKVDTKWLAPKRKIDSAMARDLVSLAIRRNLVCEPAWVLVVTLRKDGRISVKNLDDFLNLLIQKTAQDYPEFSCRMVLELVPTLADADQREKAYQRSLAVYGRRPDLKGRILLALAEECRQRGETKKAIQAYQVAATEAIVVPDIVVSAASKAEDLLRTENRQLAALRLYEMLFAKTSKENCAEEFRKETSRYKLGTRFAELLKEAGKAELAEKILADL